MYKIHLCLFCQHLKVSCSGKIVQSLFPQSLNEEQNVDSLSVQMKMGRNQFSPQRERNKKQSTKLFEG